MYDDAVDPLYTEKQIQSKIEEMAAEITADYTGREIRMIGVLKGAFMVISDLARAMQQVPLSIDFMSVASYGSGTTTSGVVRILKDLDQNIAGQHVLVVEDVIDSGLTLNWLLRNLKSRQPASIEVAALLRKKAAARVDVPVKYVGFDIEDVFVVGYGLDYAEKYRNLPFIGTLRA